MSHLLQQREEYDAKLKASNSKLQSKIKQTNRSITSLPTESQDASVILQTAYAQFGSMVHSKEQTNKLLADMQFKNDVAKQINQQTFFS